VSFFRVEETAKEAESRAPIVRTRLTANFMLVASWLEDVGSMCLGNVSKIYLIPLPKILRYVFVILITFFYRLTGLDRVLLIQLSGPCNSSGS
jgi:hypothetical protein